MSLNKTSQVTDYLNENGYITAAIAEEEFQVTRLRDIISKLRKKGMKIKSEKYKIEKKTHVKYVLERKKK